jgi:signal peptidase II
MSRWARVLLVLGILAGCFAADQLTKIWAVTFIKNAPAMTFLWETIRIEYAENTGAWGSLGGGWSEPVRFWALMVLPSIVLAGIAWFAAFKDGLSRLEVWAYALIVGGGAGNLWDRFMHGYVVDFLWMGVGRIGTNVFNIADTIIMLAFGLILIHAWRARHS